MPEGISIADAILDKSATLRAQVGLEPTPDTKEAATIVLTSTALEVIQTDDCIAHPEQMSVQDATLAWAFICFMSAPIISSINIENKQDKSKFLVSVASAVFQFFDEKDIVHIYESGTNLFQKAVTSGGDSEAFVNFCEQVNKLILIHIIGNNTDAITGLRNRYAAFQKLVFGK